ncbi:MAG: thiamine pyrophosphate-binding protein [Isosphaeraceae bacterium]|nr:thiamine pyrophosphate-binding protein [Isosphaeraceae bacterium]
MAWNRREAIGSMGVGAAGVAATLAASDEAGAALLPGQSARSGHVPGVRGVFGRMTGAQSAVAALLAEGVPCVFGVPGAQNNEFWDAMKSMGQPYLLVTNEMSCSVMADASARVTGCVGVFSVVPGPGLTNAMSGIGEALLDSVPIVGLITDVSRGPNKPAFQVHSLPNAPIARSVSKATLEVRHQGQIPGAIHEAFRLARAGEPGPVTVMLPYDLLLETWDYDHPVPPPYATAFDEAGYRKAVHLLSDRRKRVGIYAGGGCVDAGPRLAAVAEMLQAPVATSVSGKGVIPDHHPLAVGWGYGEQGTRAAERAFRDVDLVLAVGVKYSEVSTANYAIPQHEELIHVDICRENLGRNVPTSACVQADADTFFARLLGDAALVSRPARTNLPAKLCSYRREDDEENRRIAIQEGVDPMHFLVQLRQLLGPDELIFVDVTASTHWASEAVKVPGPRRYFAPANNQSMGWAIPAAIGAKKVRFDREVVCVTGDGCFLMAGMEMSTAVRAGLPVKFFVFDDGAYHYMQMLQEPTFRRTTATELASINYAHYAAALGLAYNEILTNDDVCNGILRALGCGAPLLTRVAISYEGREIRWLNAAKSSYIRHLNGSQKRRMGVRIVARSLDRTPEND